MSHTTKDDIIGAAACAALLIAGLLALSASFASAQEPRTHFYLVIENGGVVEDHDEARQTIEYMLGELVQLRRRRATRDARIQIILTANPTEVTWSGTADDLFEQGRAVLDLIAFRDTCSDLALAWQQVSTTMQITMPDEIRLVVIGPGINAPFPCADGETTISLPQDVPDDFPLGALALEASQLRLLLVHPDQDDVYLDFFRRSGVLLRAQAGELDFDLMDPARTRAALGRILEERK